MDSRIGTDRDTETVRYSLLSGEMLALTQVVHALARVMAAISPQSRQLLRDELGSRRETLEALAAMEGGTGEAHAALVPLSLLIREID